MTNYINPLECKVSFACKKCGYPIDVTAPASKNKNCTNERVPIRVAEKLTGLEVNCEPCGAEWYIDEKPNSAFTSLTLLENS